MHLHQEPDTGLRATSGVSYLSKDEVQYNAISVIGLDLGT